MTFRLRAEPRVPLSTRPTNGAELIRQQSPEMHSRSSLFRRLRTVRYVIVITCVNRSDCLPVFLGLLTSVVLGVASAFMAAVAWRATALIVPGTGTPNANVVTELHADTPATTTCRDRVRRARGCNTYPGTDLFGINYPGSRSGRLPFNNWCPGLTCDTWNESVGEGVTAPRRPVEALVGQPGASRSSYSATPRAASVVGLEKMAAGQPDPGQKARMQIVTIGNIGNPERRAVAAARPLLGHDPDPGT